MPLKSFFLATLLATSTIYVNSAGTAEVKTAAEAVAVQIRDLFLNSNSDGSGAWGDLADLMGLLVRLEFHDAITYDPDTGDGGADGCIDLLSPSNKGLREGIDLLEPIRLGEQNKAILSRADVWALAANIMIETAGGPRLEYKAGRVDVDSCEGHGMRHIEAESLASVEISEVFVDRLDFSPREVVALMGAHVLGRARENNSGYDGPWVREPTKFTNAYFSDLIKIPWVLTKANIEPFGERTTWRRWIVLGNQEEIMLQTDVDLAYETNNTGMTCSRVGGVPNKAVSCPLATNAFSSHVVDFASSQALWFNEFATAWAKLTSLTDESLYCITDDCKTPRSSGKTTTSYSVLCHFGLVIVIYIFS
mmetsp:Transcript_3221/g.8231  ORF Transcript_3221/g.8231 Transcript_3221/m.8231 type:complete len:364 (+) Transcript_3221:79-1170(+)